MKREGEEEKERQKRKGKNKTSGETDARLDSLILSVLKRHNSRLQSCTVKSTLNPFCCYLIVERFVKYGQEYSVVRHGEKVARRQAVGAPAAG